MENPIQRELENPCMKSIPLLLPLYSESACSDYLIAISALYGFHLLWKFRPWISIQWGFHPEGRLKV